MRFLIYWITFSFSVLTKRIFLKESIAREYFLEILLHRTQGKADDRKVNQNQG